MRLKNILLDNFRNHKRTEISFQKEGAFFYGKNGAGKTNILEALYIFAYFKSFRSAQLQDMIFWDNPYTYISGEFEDINGLSNTLELSFSKKKKECKINGKKIHSLADIFGFFQVLEFTQKDNQIILGSPDLRRRFFDIACSLDSKIYYNTLRNYNRALKQRNIQIRTDLEKGTNDRHVWNESLVNYGVQIIEMRCAMIEKLVTICNEKLEYISEQLRLSIQYHTSVDKENLRESFLAQLTNNEKRENVFKSTVVGPHRDKILIKNHGRMMKNYSSQGEIRLAVLAMKLALVEYLGNKHTIFPILIFDDILLEIDRKNIQAILDKFGNKNQFFFTSTEVPAVDYFKNMSDKFFFHVADGEVLSV